MSNSTENQVGHTPGPWVVGRKTSAYYHIEGNPQEIEGQGSVVEPVCKVDRQLCGLANAHLIATAPELLAKLSKIAAWLARMATRSEELASDKRFPSLAEACAADARNYRATHRDIQSLILKAKGGA